MSTLAADDPLPFAPGTSPFRAKGVLFRGALAEYERVVPGGLEAVRRRARPELSAYFGQTFLAASWYDVLPLIPFSAAAAHVKGMPHIAFVREASRAMAGREINTVYRLLLKLSSPKSVAARMPAWSLQLFDFGKAEGAMVDDKTFQGCEIGIPVFVVSWFKAGTEAYCATALELAGARDVKFTWRPSQPAGARDGMELVALPFEVKWK